MNEFITSPLSNFLTALLPIIFIFIFKNKIVFKCNKKNKTNCNIIFIFTISIITSSLLIINGLALYYKTLNSEKQILEKSKTDVTIPKTHLESSDTASTLSLILNQKTPTEPDSAPITVSEEKESIIEQTTAITTNTNNNYLDTSRTAFHLCQKVINGKPINFTFNIKKSIHQDSLLKTKNGYSIITCYGQVYGTKMNLEDSLYYNWINKTENIPFPPYKQAIKLNTLGYRTWATKKVWIGEWELNITNSSGINLQTLNFSID